MSAALAQDIRAEARSLGFLRVAFAPADPAEEEGRRLADWCRAGRAGEMSWLARDPQGRASPATLLPEARTVIALAVPMGGGRPPPSPGRGWGRVARYAWGRDYHEIIRPRLESLAGSVRARLGPGAKVRSTLDVEPILERGFARRAGLGFIGKNAALVVPGAGSHVFLALLLLDREVPDAGARGPRDCGACRACMGACPTGALDGPGSLDARLCAAYHTIENRGFIPREVRSRLGSWVFGCDDCQDACPHNARVPGGWKEFDPERGPGPWVALRPLIALRSQGDFARRFSGTALPRARRAGLVRNACLAAANQGLAEEWRGDLEDALRHDPSPVVRGHAAWALGTAGSLHARAALERAWTAEPDPLVRGEIAAARGEG